MKDKDFTLEITSIQEDIVKCFIEALDWEFNLPLDFFPDPLKLEVGDEFSISVSIMPEKIFQDVEFGGFKPNPPKSRILR